MSNKRLAIIGSRGIPAKYGGFETCAEVIAFELSKKKWSIWVSCEGNNTNKIKDYAGAKLFYCPFKPFYRVIYETIYDVYSLIFSSISSEIIYMLGYGSGIFLFIPKLFRKKIVVNMDGLEWAREKYNPLEKQILRLCERLAISFGDVIIADSKNIKRYLDETYKVNSLFITNGVNILPEIPWNYDNLYKFFKKNINLSPLEYWLVIARLEPENQIHLIIDGYLQSNSKMPLVIIGNFSNNKYARQISLLLNGATNNKVLMLGAIYDSYVLNMLRCNCYAYIHGHKVGGTNPSLLEIMSFKKIILAYSSKFNKEVGANSLLYFKDIDELARLINFVETDFAHVKKCGVCAFEQVKSHYSWKQIINEYNNLFNYLLNYA